jgi:putative ATPase
VELFPESPNERREDAPLAERVRPRNIDEFVGQDHLLAPRKPLRVLIERGEIPSVILWGPPGSGKTTLARIIAHHANAEFHQLNAVAAGVKDVRKIIDRAEANRKRFHRRTILFIDEIHRFNKAQQDALLHSVEEGVVTLIGATTENPSFEIIPPLMSRCRLYILQPLGVTALNEILDRALKSDRMLLTERIHIDQKERELLMLHAGGDARVMLNGLETAARLVKPEPSGERIVTTNAIEETFQQRFAKYDKGGEEHYNIISAFIKSVRGSDPDAAIYWMARMLAGGEDPTFIARRMVVLASEDIGNADPYAITMATSCFAAVDYIGMPEARIVLAQTATYLAAAPKSNAAYMAIQNAMADVERQPHDSVPLHLRNAPTGLMRKLDYGREYQYSHDHPDHFVEQQYLPDTLRDKVYYHPTDMGAERTLRERLNAWWTKRKR